jgi:hypothetical protein
VGGYTDSRGNIVVRGEVADFIQRRDGHKPETEVSLGGVCCTLPILCAQALPSRSTC